MSKNDDADITVVMCKCGAAVFLAVTSTMTKADHTEVGEMIAEGHSAKHLPASEARITSFGCKCTNLGAKP